MKEEKIANSDIKELKHHTRRLSIKEGLYWSIRSSFADHYIAPFAIATGMTNSLVTILNSLWNLDPISQLFGSRLVKNGKRKSIVAKTVALDAVSWLLMAILGIFYIKNMFENILPYLILLTFSLFLFSAGLGHPAWFSLIGDSVDGKYRGRWWGKRSTIISFSTVILAITAAFGLKYFASINQEVLGFVILFAIAFAARLACVKLIKNHYEPRLKEPKEKKLKFKQFIQDSKKTNFGKFTIFRMLLSFAFGLTAPIISIYLIRYLNFDYITYILITLSASIFSIITLNLWGKIADKYGNYRVIALTTILIPLTPLLWILSSNKIYLFLIPGIIGGTSYTAFILASRNFIYDNVKKQDLGQSISYFNLLIGIGSFVGGLISAYLIENLKINSINPIYIIFLLGMITRMIVVAIFVPQISEIKKRRGLENMNELKKIVFKEARPTIIEDLNEILEIKNYLKEK